MLMAANVQRYVAIKRGLGYSFADQEQMLQRYAAFADARGEACTTVSGMIEWASGAPSIQSRLDPAREHLHPDHQFRPMGVQTGQRVQLPAMMLQAIVLKLQE